MPSGLQREKPRKGEPGKPGGLVVAVVGGILVLRALPLIRAYGLKLSARHSLPMLAAAALAGLLAFALLTLALQRRPGIAACALGAAALAMTVLSGNTLALLAAAAILATTALLGDAVFRLLSGADAGDGDLHAIFAAGAVSVGTLVVFLDLTGRLGAPALAVLAVLVVILRARRIPELVRLARGVLHLPRGDAPRGLDASWLALAGLLLLATWAGAQAPDFSWDGLMYHLPEARDIAVSGRVRPLADLAPQTFLWRAHEAYLSLAFFLGGESGGRAESAARIIQFLQYGTGLCVFGAALALARRLGARGVGPLVVLALAGLPTAMLQLHSAYVDWPAALAVTAAAAQLAAAPGNARRLRVAGLLFGGAVSIKVFAVFAAPALLVLALRKPRDTPRRAPLFAAALCALIPLAPWLLWSQVRAGSIATPYAASPRELLARVSSGHYFERSPATGEARTKPGLLGRAAAFLRLPYDMVFHSSLFEPNGDGYNGLLVLLLLLGLAGWDARRNLLFLAAALPFLVPWSLLYHPSMRFLFPVFPLYAVYTAEGLSRFTGRFRGASGRAGGVAVLVSAAAFPVQFGSSGLEWKAALGLVSREEALAARLPSVAFSERLRSEDRVVIVGENDRFHLPASVVWRAEYLPVSAWGGDASAWRRGLDALGITAVIWRSDRVPFPVLESLSDRLSPVAENGPARLYEVLRP